MNALKLVTRKAVHGFLTGLTWILSGLLLVAGFMRFVLHSPPNDDIRVLVFLLVILGVARAAVKRTKQS
jgi:TRAP-type C4-dicarboxylate transport system permease small subunit